MSIETYTLEKNSTYEDYLYKVTDTSAYVIFYFGDGLLAPALQDFSNIKIYQLSDGKLILAKPQPVINIKDENLIITTVNNDARTITICQFNDIDYEPPRGTRAAPAA